MIWSHKIISAARYSSLFIRHKLGRLEPQWLCQKICWVRYSEGLISDQVTLWHRQSVHSPTPFSLVVARAADMFRSCDHVCHRNRKCGYWLRSDTEDHGLSFCAHTESISLLRSVSRPSVPELASPSWGRKEDCSSTPWNVEGITTRLCRSRQRISQRPLARKKHSKYVWMLARSLEWFNRK